MRHGHLLLGVATSALASALLAPVLAIPAAAAGSSSCPTEPAPITAAQSERVLAVADRKLALAAAGPRTKFPFGAIGQRSEYTRTSAYSWTSGFFPASMWLRYQRLQTPETLALAQGWSSSLAGAADWNGTHDLGFMIGLPYGLGLQLDPSRQTAYRTGILTAARTLSERWNPKVRALKSADYGRSWGVIVDSAMNAPMLIEAGRMVGGAEGAELERRGTEHMRTLARTFVRADGSTYHRMAFNPRTGKLFGPLPGQGLNARTSTWSRGQAWALHGFATAARLTEDPELMAAAERTADYWIKATGPGCIPAWDFSEADLLAPRDSGAAAIAASGLLELAEVPGVDAQRYREAALLTLGTLAREPWVSTTSRNPGILQRQTLSVPADRREGSYVWGDYYLLAAIAAALKDRTNGS